MTFIIYCVPTIVPEFVTYFTFMIYLNVRIAFDKKKIMFTHQMKLIFFP